MTHSEASRPPTAVSRTGRIASVLGLAGGLLGSGAVLFSFDAIIHRHVGATEQLIALLPLLLLLGAILLSCTGFSNDPPPGRKLRLATATSALVWIAFPCVLLAPFCQPLLTLAVIFGCLAVSWKSAEITTPRARKLRLATLISVLVMGVPAWIASWPALSMWFAVAGAIDELAVLLYPLFFVASIVLTVWARKEQVQPAWAIVLAFLGVHLVFLSQWFAMRAALMLYASAPIAFVLSIIFLVRAARGGATPAWVTVTTWVSVVLQFLLTGLMVFLLLAAFGAH